MSRIGKNPIIIPKGVTCCLLGSDIIINGKLGELKFDIPFNIKAIIKDNLITITPLDESKKTLMLWGTVRSIISNLVEGVNKGFYKYLELKVLGYRASIVNKDLVLNLGYSHVINYNIPEGISITCVNPTSITVHGSDKQRVGQTAAEIRSFRKPEPYKGKGIKYKDEVIFRKEGKKK